jgi:hypothetical protein
MNTSTVYQSHRQETLKALAQLSELRCNKQQQLKMVDNQIKTVVALALRHNVSWHEVGRAMRINPGSAWRKYRSS